MSAPTPAEVDRKAARYYALKEALDEATEQAKLRTIPLVQLKAKLVELVSAYGSCHAEKSNILHGVTTEMVATFGQSVTIDACGGAVQGCPGGIQSNPPAEACLRADDQVDNEAGGLGYHPGREVIEGFAGVVR